MLILLGKIFCLHRYKISRSKQVFEKSPLDIGSMVLKIYLALDQGFYLYLTIST